MYDEPAEGGDAERTIARIWRITLARQSPLAVHALRVLAWYAPQALPRAVLESPDAPPEERRAIGALSAYNLITLDEHAITVHRLVQAVTRTPSAADPYRRPADIALARHHATLLLAAALPDVPGDPAGWPVWRALLPHSTALLEHAPPDTDTRETALLCVHTGLFLVAQREPPIPLFERSLADHTRVLGGDDPRTLTTRNNLAIAYVLAGDPGRAIPLLEQNLRDRERVGPRHPDTLDSRRRLATARGRR